MIRLAFTSLKLSLGLALWSASAGVKSLFQAMNVAYGESEDRNFIQFNGLALLFTHSCSLVRL